MKLTKVNILIMAVFFGLCGCSNSTDPSTWSSEKTNKWFDDVEWLGGWSAKPDATINKTAFALQYYKNSERWDKAFAFLKENDLTKLELKRYDIDGDNLFVIVSEYNSKERENCRFEAHKKYADIQYVAAGIEYLGLVPIAQKDSVLAEYDETKDIEFFTVKNEATYPATPENFLVFFPEDAHMPGLKADSISLVRKIVVKIKLD